MCECDTYLYQWCHLIYFHKLAYLSCAKIFIFLEEGYLCTGWKSICTMHIHWQERSNLK